MTRRYQREYRSRNDYYGDVGGGLVFDEWYLGRPATFVTLMNIEDGMTLAAQFVPTKLDESVEVEYERLSVPGLSHKPMQFKNTGNLSYDLELYFRALSEEERLMLLNARKFLHSICYPRQSANEIVTGAPARILFIWPRIVSIVAVVTGVQFSISRVAKTLAAVEMTAKLTLEEVRDTRLLAEDVWRRDTRRGEEGLLELTQLTTGGQEWLQPFGEEQLWE